VAVGDDHGGADPDEAAMTPRFVVLEGGEGCGKSTQAARLAAHLGAVLTRQPGGTPIGARLRELLLGEPEDEVAAPGMAPRTEALLMAADRAQHVAELIGPALAGGRHVVCDRYIPSSVAYQGIGRGLGADEVRRISEWAVDGLDPDLVVLLVVPPEVAAARTGAPRDRIEAAGDDFHRRVGAAFVAMAEADPAAWAVVDGVGTEDEVWDRVRAVVSERLGIGG
jgi:dTMP kinase